MLNKKIDQDNIGGRASGKIYALIQQIRLENMVGIAPIIWTFKNHVDTLKRIIANSGCKAEVKTSESIGHKSIIRICDESHLAKEPNKQNLSFHELPLEGRFMDGGKNICKG